MNEYLIYMRILINLCFGGFLFWAGVVLWDKVFWRDVSFRTRIKGYYNEIILVNENGEIVEKIERKDIPEIMQKTAAMIMSAYIIALGMLIAILLKF